MMISKISIPVNSEDKLSDGSLDISNMRINDTAAIK